MKNLKKGLLTLTFAFVMVMVTGVVNVNAEEYKLEDKLVELQTGTELVLTNEDTLSYDDEIWFGKEDARFTINSGTVTFKYDSASDASEYGIVNITMNGVVYLNEGKNFFTQIELLGMKVPVNLTVTNDAILDVKGTLVIPSGVNSVLVNNGNININGNFELRDRANNYQGTGFLNIFGNLAVYGTSGNNIGNYEIHIHNGANIYSEANISDNLVITKADDDTATYEIVENGKNYESVTADIGSRNFPYGYTVKVKETTDVPVTDDEQTNTEESSSDNETTNPETSDEIIIYSLLVLISVIGIGSFTINLKKRNN